MPEYLSPGVYVQEVQSTTKPIAGVSTSTPGFIGLVATTTAGTSTKEVVRLVAKDTPNPGPPPTPRSKLVDYEITSVNKKPHLVTNFTEYTKLFGDLVGDSSLPTSASGAAIDAGLRNLTQAVYGFFNNGGSRCYVARVKDSTELVDALEAFETIDEIALVAVPGQTDAATYDALVAHCARMEDRFAILDGPATATDLDTLKAIPAASPPGVAPGNTDLAAWYFPWIQVFDPATKLQAPNGDGLLAVPPSGHIAGIYARVDAAIGVHKAPANEVIRGALAVTQLVSKNDQNGLNPAGVNCIRVLNGNILVWGARTVGGNANADLKYINVRRTLLFLKESIDEGTQFVVFQPNEPRLWQKIVRNVTAFLMNVWRAGALFGSTPQEAFFVKCDAELNPPEVRDAGQVITEVGVAIVRPAEFVIFRLSQFTAPSA